MEEKKNYAYPEEENFFRDVLNKYMPFWPLFVLLVALGLAGAWVYLRYKVPVYKASATILVKDDKKGMDGTSIMESMDMFGGKKIVENEIEVIKSRTLAREVVRELKLYAPVTVEGKISDRPGYLSAPIQVEVKNPDSFQTAKQVYFELKGGWVNIDKQNYALNKWVKTPYGELKFNSNPKYQKTAETTDRPMFFALQTIKESATQLLSRLTVSASSKQSTVINLNYEDEVPLRAEEILNALVTVYNNAAIKDKNTLAANTLEFVEKRLSYVVGELDSVEGKMQDYRMKNKLVDISAQGQLYLQTVGANDQKISDLDMQQAVLGEVQNYVIGKTKQGGIVPSTLGISDPVLSQLLQTLYDSELQYERLKQTTPENNPILLSLADQIAKIKPNILENIRNQKRSLAAGRGDLSSTNGRFNSMLSTIPQKERELLEISRQQSIKNNIYTFLLQKREETALSYASTVADSRLVDVAEAGRFPVSPKPKMIYLIAFFGSIILGVGLVSLKDVINNTILYRSEIEKLTTAPILGEVMHEPSKSPIIIMEGKRTFIAEQFRQLRTSLGYLGINSRKKRIMITSTISGEGKSFISANLGVSLALMGKKVVLLEMDMRKPKLSEHFNLSRETGLSNFFIGSKDPIEVIKSVPNQPNLFVIPSGPIPPNPSELLVNGKLEELLAYLDKTFDYILIDTAPVSPVTDAYLISPLCDATLYVIRHGVTPKMFVQKMDEQNKIRELKNRAIVFNGVKQRGVKGYGNSYGYGNGYGYTEDNPKKRNFKQELKNLVNIK